MLVCNKQKRRGVVLLVQGKYRGRMNYLMISSQSSSCPNTLPYSSRIRTHANLSPGHGISGESSPLYSGQQCAFRSSISLGTGPAGNYRSQKVHSPQLPVRVFHIRSGTPGSDLMTEKSGQNKKKKKFLKSGGIKNEWRCAQNYNPVRQTPIVKNEILVRSN